MPVAVQRARNIQMVRDAQGFYGLNDKKPKKSKPLPWVDVSDDDDRGSAHGKSSKPNSHSNGDPNGLKRKASTMNGNGPRDHSHSGMQNGHVNGVGHKHKKRRHSVHQDDEASTSQLNGNGNDYDQQEMPSPNGAGPSQPKKAHTNGVASPAPLTAKAKAIQQQRKDLPIFQGKDGILEEIQKHDVTVILGETGSGKTTQIPQYIHESGLSQGLIGITQPRRIAATSLASRVSAEQNTALGTLVGYSVRFDERHSPGTRIKFLTDGMMVREMMSDPLLLAYSVVIVDEAHERTLRTDLLVANLKEIQRRRNGEGAGKGKANGESPLKIVIMSATLDEEKFTKFFPGAKIVYVKGRQHPVKAYYSKESQLDYTEAAFRTFFQIHTDQPPGDVLIFLPGQEDIESVQKSIQLFANQLPSTQPAVLTCTMFAAQDNTQNSKVFNPAPPNTRKCILATNIAETSITIPGIKYVIDTGKCKEKQYLARAAGGGFDTLLTRDITKSSAKQRMGRAGREGVGVCFRLYTEEAFKNMAESGEPEILRCSLTSSMLSLKCLGQSLEALDLMDKPDQESIISALKTLWILGAIDNNHKLTSEGRQMALFPLEPQYACAVVASKTYGCTSEILDIVSIVSASSKLFLDISEQREAVADARRKFRHPTGDHMTILNAVRAYREVALSEKRSGRKEWCRKQFLNEKTFLEARDIREQLVGTCKRVGVDPEASVAGSEKEDVVVRCMGHGLVGNSAFLQPDGSYKQTLGQTIVKVHPGSSLVDKKVPAIIYDELMYTNQIYARGVSSIPKSFFLAVPAFKQRQA